MINMHSFLTGAICALTMNVGVGPASAQLGIDLDVDPGVEVDVESDVAVRVGEPYEYRGYQSGRWYPYEEPRRNYVYYEQYGGYDCYKSFRYTWRDGYRARYDAYWCYDEDGGRYQVDDTRVVVRID